MNGPSREKKHAFPVLSRSLFFGRRGQGFFSVSEFLFRHYGDSMASMDYPATRSVLSTEYTVSRSKLFRYFIFGFVMGSADIVPGVSGGTMALILGIYERFVRAVGDGARMIASFVFLRPREGQERFRALEWGLILPLGMGILTALGAMAWILDYFLEEYPVYTGAAFFGLVAASLQVPWGRRVERPRVHLFLAAASALLAFTILGFSESTGEEEISTLKFLMSGALASCAMILPGVSGAFLLEVMGVYEAAIDALKELDIVVLASVGMGALVGLGGFSQFLKWALERHHDVAMVVLAGLMAGSLRALWPWQSDEIGKGADLQMPAWEGSTFLALLVSCIAVSFVFGLLRFASETEDAAARDDA